MFINNPDAIRAIHCARIEMAKRCLGRPRRRPTSRPGRRPKTTIRPGKSPAFPEEQ